MENFRILELFSGIGGMHYAFKYSKLHGNVVAAMDINTIANAVYTFNHPSAPAQNSNIQSLTRQKVEKLNVNMILMSPPCQPHTRVGNKRDIKDHRSDGLQHICTLLPECPNIQYVLMENVKGFEGSEARKCYLKALQKAGFYFRELILSPTQFGVPNTRHRYYCIARKNSDFSFAGESIWETMPRPLVSNTDSTTIKGLLQPESSCPVDTYLTGKVLAKRVWVMDIVTADACNTMCFTKAYTYYSEGTGSIYSHLSSTEIDTIFEQVKLLEEIESNDNKRLNLLKKLQLRYFTPREVARLMSFPESFDFPTETTNRQKYRLLGNSINVCVVGELIKLMCL